jgi:hypothetical protein
MQFSRRSFVEGNEVFAGKYVLMTLVLLSMICAAMPAQAASLGGIALADTESAVFKAGWKVTHTEKRGGILLSSYVRERGTELHVDMAIGSKRVAYIELDWDMKTKGIRPGVFGLRFGVSALADIQRAMGSNGFFYKGGPGFQMAPVGLVLANSYEVESPRHEIVTFITLVAPSDAPKAAANRGRDVGRYAHLIGVILALPPYLDLLWGRETAADPANRPVQWWN